MNRFRFSISRTICVTEDQRSFDNNKHLDREAPIEVESKGGERLRSFQGSALASILRGRERNPQTMTG